MHTVGTVTSGEQGTLSEILPQALLFLAVCFWARNCLLRTLLWGQLAVTVQQEEC